MNMLALHRDADVQASVIWEINGESILLGTADRVEMDEDRVAFFSDLQSRAPFPESVRGASLRRGARNVVDEDAQALAA